MANSNKQTKSARKPTPRKTSTKAKTQPAPPETVLVLRTCAADMSAHGGFVWPESGPVSAPDWSPAAVCGQGLHGLLWGCGDGSLLSWGEDAKWLVVEVLAAEVVELDGKVKFPRGQVVLVGTRSEATQYIAAKKPGAIVGVDLVAGTRGTATAGYGGTATAGDGGTATAGVRGTATAGYGGTATAGDGGTATAGGSGTATAVVRGTATAGYGGTATAGGSGTATAGYGGTATAGDGGTATAGGSGTATAGDGGTATAGDGGTATAGVRGTATAGVRGTATAGYGGTVVLKHWDGRRYRLLIGYVGEGGIEAGKPYRVDASGKIVPVQS